MSYNSPFYNRQTIRLQGFDYSRPGYYFVTLCVKNRGNYLGFIDENNEMCLSEIGEIVQKYWKEIPEHFPHVRLDEFIIMPNHIHGIIEITRYPDHFKPEEVHSGEVQNFEPLQNEPLQNERINRFQKIIPGSLGSIIRGFKIGVTKWCKLNGHEDFQWQRNYHEVIIRNDFHLINVRNYIKNNPYNWDDDEINYKKLNIKIEL